MSFILDTPLAMKNTFQISLLGFTVLLGLVITYFTILSIKKLAFTTTKAKDPIGIKEVSLIKGEVVNNTNK